MHLTASWASRLCPDTAREFHLNVAALLSLLWAPVAPVDLPKSREN